MVPEGLESLTPEKRAQLYRMLRLKAVAYEDGSIDLSGFLGDNFCTLEMVS
jgi:hypothetical protein